MVSDGTSTISRVFMLRSVPMDNVKDCLNLARLILAVPAATALAWPGLPPRRTVSDFTRWCHRHVLYQGAMLLRTISGSKPVGVPARPFPIANATRAVRARRATSVAGAATRGRSHGIGMKIGCEVGTFQWVWSHITSPGLAMPNTYVPGET